MFGVGVKVFESTSGEAAQVFRKIEAFNMEHVRGAKLPYFHSLKFVAKDSTGKVLGGVMGDVVFGLYLTVYVLWVDEEYRKDGIGTILMKKLEQSAKERGATFSQVDTFDFQAKGFYEKIGYDLFGTLEDSPSEGHKRYYLKKRLVKAK